MATKTPRRIPWQLVLGALLAVLAASLITFTDLAWRGVVGWAVLALALLLVVTGGLTWRQQSGQTDRA